MNRKDCESKNKFNRRWLVVSSLRTLCAVILSAIVLNLSSTQLLAGSIRIWPAAVVVSDSIRMDDLCEFKGFDAETEKKIASLRITASPSPGGSRIIHIEMIRATLASNKVNMAIVCLKGATNCQVSRPSTIENSGNQAPTTSGVSKQNRREQHRQPTESKRNAVKDSDLIPSSDTLRHAVIDFFNRELKRYQGRAEVVFDHTSNQVLDLSGPQYTFHVRRRQNHPLGLIPLEVDVRSEGRTVQTVPLVVQVTMIRSGLVTRRAINQGATIKNTDIETASLTFTRISKLGMNQPAHAVGQRAKKFLAAGSIIQESDIESVPLVNRGQLVTLTSVSGSISVVTTAKAAEEGLLGDVIKVRAVDNKRVEYDATVIGPGKVQIGHGAVQHQHTIRVARGQGS